jgi:hypothetical protein
MRDSLQIEHDQVTAHPGRQRRLRIRNRYDARPGPRPTAKTSARSRSFAHVIIMTVMILLYRRADSGPGARYVLWLLLILAIGSYALWAAMDLFVRSTGINWLM